MLSRCIHIVNINGKFTEIRKMFLIQNIVSKLNVLSLQPLNTKPIFKFRQLKLPRLVSL